MLNSPPNMQEIVNTETGILQRIRNYFIPQGDLTLPHRTRRIPISTEERLQNQARLLVRHSFNQRTQLRLFFDCLTRQSGRSTYKRMLGQTVYLDCPTPEQAELAIEAILAFAQSLDGKWLAPNPTDQVVGSESHVADSKMLRYYSPDRSESGETSAGNPQAIGTASAGNSSVEAGKSAAQEPGGLTAQQDSGNGENP